MKGGNHIEPITLPCIIHSLGGKEAEATILEKTGDNQYVAVFNGVKCSAIYNPFVGRFYVDDKYGVIRDNALKMDDRGR